MSAEHPLPINNKMSRGRKRCECSRLAARPESDTLMLETPEPYYCVACRPYVTVKDSGCYHHPRIRVQAGKLVEAGVQAMRCAVENMQSAKPVVSILK